MSAGAVAAAVVLLLLNGFFVAVEFSLVASRRTRLEDLAEAGGRRARAALAATSDLSLQLAGAQLGITVASLVLGYVAEPAAVHGLETAFGPLSLPPTLEHIIALVLGLGIVVFLHLVVGEMAPKGIALADPERTLLWLAVPNRWYTMLFRPFIRVLNGSSNLCFRVLGMKPVDEVSMVHTAEELAVLVAESHEEGVIEDFAHELLTGVLDFGGRDAGAVMVPQAEMVTIPRTATVAEVEQVVVRTGHSRLPVTGGGPDEVVGFVHSKDLLAAEGDASDEVLPARMIRRLLIVPPTRNLEDLLLSMRFSRVHVAVVSDDEGRTVGLVTLEDLLEELVGDILDETDEPPTGEPTHGH